MPSDIYAQIGRFKVTKSWVQDGYFVTGIAETELSPRVGKAIERIPAHDADGWERFWSKEVHKIDSEIAQAIKAAHLAPEGAFFME